MRVQKKATIIATLTAAGLAVLKFVIGIASGSIAILSSAIDSLLDMGVSLFNTFALHNAEKHPDEKYNYGRGKTEALASFIEGIIISISGIFIFSESLRKIFHGETVSNIDIGIGVMIVSVIVTFVLVSYLQRVAKKTASLVMESDALHYKTDLFSNLAILASLVVIYLTGWYIIDAILGMLIACYIVYEAWKIIKKGYELLLDVSLPDELVAEVQKVLDTHPEIESYHFFKTRKSGDRYFVEAHLVFGQDMLLSRAHLISHDIEHRIENLSSEAKWNILFHLDPYDDSRFDTRES